ISTSIGAEYHYKNKRFKSFIMEMDAIIENQPYAEIAYAFTLSRLINANLFTEAEKYLTPLHKLNPNDYTYKWIGSFALNKGEYAKAIKNLNESIKINPNDPQVFYNLSGAYFNSGNILEALKAVEKCLNLNPNNPRAKQFYNSLKSLNKKSNSQIN
ncbi:MAG: tetratricopeptide repeat protein, partial [Melioribacteraceae bacterium]|nr:tetratricopeptide repeat protein [Melioribacteraceae bacterium]